MLNGNGNVEQKKNKVFLVRQTHTLSPPHACDEWLLRSCRQFWRIVIYQRAQVNYNIKSLKWKCNINTIENTIKCGSHENVEKKKEKTRTQVNERYGNGGAIKA